MPIATPPATAAVRPPLPPLDRIGSLHIAYVRSLLVRLNVTPAHEREDIAQEVLIRVHRSRDTHLEPRALLYGITHHVVLRWKKKLRDRAVALAAFIHTQVAPAIEPGAEEESRAAAGRIEIVHQAIDDLDPMLRKVFVRSQIEGAKMAEIAREAEIPKSTGYTRLHAARIRFAQVLRRKMARRHLREGDL
jgi:RNA polymerase sigma factor (sigma-70 family)